MPARTRRASSARAEAPEECPENSGGNTDAVVLHGGLTLRERWIDADTVEYAVRRSLRDAFARSSAIAWFALALALFGASLATGELSGDAIGARVPHPPLLAAGFLTAILAARAAASCVVSESILVMRRVGVRLTTRRALARPSSRFVDAGRIRSIVVHEAVTGSDVFHYMCFRPFPRRAGSNPPRKVILAYPNLRPALPILREAYARVHDTLFEGDSDDDRAPPRVAGRRGARTREVPRDSWGSDAREPLEGPASGRGWWGHGETWDAGGAGPRPGLGRRANDWEAKTDAGMRAPRQSVLMVSDFFIPNTGGVELHMYALAQRLIARGHKVTVLTHAYGDRCGVRYMSNGLKVYYAFRTPVYNGATCPDIFGTFRLLRLILLRERVTVVHAHQTFSVMGHEAVCHARTMGYKCVFTDHSLFGFADTSAIHMNKLLALTLADCNHVVCVSHTAKENLVLRSGTPPLRVSVVPNAVDGVRFTPDSTRRPGRGGRPGPRDRTVVAVTARLAYRKGIHLLAAVIPLACARFPEVDFLIAGDGPMREHLEEMTREHELERRVTLLGDVPHASVVDVLQRAHVFLNCSLTESFCIAILEAACSGCLVVATGVGGVTEVLPPDLLFLAAPDPDALVEALADALDALRTDGTTNDPRVIHERVAKMYAWEDVAVRVEAVYERAHATVDSQLGRLARLHGCGTFAGKLFCAVAAVDHAYWRWLEWWRPAREVELAPDFVPEEGNFDVGE